MIFLDTDDRLVFLLLLDRVIRDLGWRCHAYCLMGNHYHLVIECGQPELSKGMQLLNGLYAAYFNHRHGRVGHLFQRRFESRAIERRGRPRPRLSVRDRQPRPGGTGPARQGLAVGRPRPAAHRAFANRCTAASNSSVFSWAAAGSPDASAPATQCPT